MLVDLKFSFTCARGWAFHPWCYGLRTLFSIWSLNYRPPTKLQDGNVFTGVRLFTYSLPTHPSKWSKVGGMHPTRMHSGYFSFDTKFPEVVNLMTTSEGIFKLSSVDAPPQFLDLDDSSRINRAWIYKGLEVLQAHAIFPHIITINVKNDTDPSSGFVHLLPLN